MKSRPLSILTFLLSFTTAALIFAQPVAAQTSPWGGVCTDDRTATGVATIQGFQCLIGNVLQVGVAGVGLAGFVMMIIGAFKYLLSGGNAKGIDEGQKTMTYAIGGLILALSAFFILNIISDFTGVQSIMNFRIPAPGINADIP
ncbi:hypothetical protein H3C66_00185 [Patescibacteria group bacterium]|nr:hypothetical protein [Patescibacteria group bacterium]